MATGAMLWGGAAYNNGIVPFKNYMFGESFTRNGEPALLKAVNDELVNLEKSGQAAKIYDVWFGPATKTPQPRAFTIEAK